MQCWRFELALEIFTLSSAKLDRKTNILVNSVEVFCNYQLWKIQQIWWRWSVILRFSIETLKSELLPSKKLFFICFIESPLKMMKKDFHFISNALFVLEIFTFLSSLFGYRINCLIRKFKLVSKFMTSKTRKQIIYNTYIDQYVKK